MGTIVIITPLLLITAASLGRCKTIKRSTIVPEFCDANPVTVCLQQAPGYKSIRVMFALWHHSTCSIVLLLSWLIISPSIFQLGEVILISLFGWWIQSRTPSFTSGLLMEDWLIHLLRNRQTRHCAREDKFCTLQTLFHNFDGHRHCVLPHSFPNFSKTSFAHLPPELEFRPGTFPLIHLRRLL